MQSRFRRFGAYDELVEAGRTLWVLPPRREPVPDAGRYLVVVDSQRLVRPGWSPASLVPHRAPARP